MYVYYECILHWYKLCIYTMNVYYTGILCMCIQKYIHRIYKHHTYIININRINTPYVIHTHRLHTYIYIVYTHRKYRYMQHIFTQYRYETYTQHTHK